MANGRHRDGTTDVRGLVIPVWAAGTIALAGLGLAFATGAFYWNVSNTLSTLASQVATLTSTALTQSDLENFCLKAEVLNKGKGWQCPFSQAEVSDETPASPQRAKRVAKQDAPFFQLP